MMARKGRKHHPSLPCDILSNLPDNLIDAILMCLPCKDAVKTSVLAKKWRYHWCRLTKFELCEPDNNCESQDDLLNPAFKYYNIICQILNYHEGDITKFTLDIQNLKGCPNIDDFIYLLSMNDIEDLVLRFPKDKPYKVPFSLFTCSFLYHLALQNCFMHPPSFFDGFERLLFLDLRRVTVCPELLGKLISECPMLSHLRLRDLEDLGIIEIDSPSLVSFSYLGRISSIRLKNVPHLSDIQLFSDSGSMESENFDFAKLLESCYALEDLHILLQDIDENADLVSARLPFDLNHVKNFNMGAMVLLENNYWVACSLCLIRSFPFLESLIIRIMQYHNDLVDDFEALECLAMERFSGVTFNHLREVRLTYFTGRRPELQLVKLFLAKSPVLETMLIDTSEFESGNEPPVTRSRSRSEEFYVGHRSLQKVVDIISEYEHASPNAKLIFKEL